MWKKLTFHESMVFAVLVMTASLTTGVTSASAEVVYKIPLLPSLVGRVAGPDLLVGTLDDVFEGGDFNVLGSPGYIQWLDRFGNTVGFGAGTSEFTYTGTNDPIPLGNNTAFNQFNTGPGFGTIGIDGAGASPHSVEIFSDHTYDIEYTFLSCDTADQTCGSPLIETDLVAGGVWWNSGDDLNSIPAIKSHPLLGDLTNYAAFTESISPVEASAYAITVISMPITSTNVRGSLVTSSWSGGTVVGVQPYFYKEPVVTSPSLIFDFESQPPDTVETGSITSLNMTQSGLTVQITRSGGASFDVHNGPFPSSWGAQALSPFANETAIDFFIATFSDPVDSVSIQIGDFGDDTSDLMLLRAFSGVGAGGDFLDTDSVFWGDRDLSPAGSADPPREASVSSALGIRSITFVGGSRIFSNSVYYDNIAVPEPDRWLLQLGALIAIGIAGRVRRGPRN
jgi:hypothetical protein